MDNEFEAVLEKGETILWAGKPAPFEKLDAEYKNKIKESIIFWAVVLVIIEACYIGTVLGLTDGKISVVAALLPVIICGLFVANHLTQADKVKKLSYALTDKNIIIKGHNVKKCPYSEIVYSDIEEDSVGTKSLVCGTQTDHIGKGLDVRSLTLMCLGKGVKGHYLADSLAMYALPEEAVSIMKQKLPIGNRF